jgi:hypothetical protein
MYIKTGTQSTAFYEYNNVQSNRTHNKFIIHHDWRPHTSASVGSLVHATVYTYQSLRNNQFKKNRCLSWIGHTIRHNEFVVNILEGAISRKKVHGKTSTTILKASHQKHRG